MSEIAFAVDLGEQYLRIADVEKRNDSLDIKALGINRNSTNFYLSEADKDLKETASRLQKLIGDAKISKKNANIVVPDSQSYSRIVEMPTLTEKELLSAIKYQADQFIPMPIDKVSLDVEIISEDKKSKKALVLIIAASNSIIEKVVKVAELAGFIPSSIENETSANLRIISYLFSQKKETAASPDNSASLFINFGHSSTSLYLFSNKLNLPVQIHNFSLGFAIFTKDINANYNVSEADAKKLLEQVGFTGSSPSYNLEDILSSPYQEFVSQMEKFIVSVKPKSNLNIGQLYFFGEGYKVAGLDKKIESSLGLETKIFDIYPQLTKNSTVNFFKHDLPLLIPAIGAAIE